MDTIGDILAASARRHADRTAIVGYHQGLTFRAVDRLANKFANGLLSIGVMRGARVGIVLANRWEYAIAYFGIARAGMVSVHIPTYFSEREFAHVLETDAVDALVVDDAMRDRIDWARSFIDDARIIVAGGRTGGEVRMMNSMWESAPDEPPDFRIDPDSVASILFSRSAAGEPKGILRSHRASVLSSAVTHQETGLRADDVIAVTMPLYHANGLCTWFQTGVLAGASSVLLGDWDPAIFTAAVSTLRVTGAFIQPMQLAALVHSTDFDADRLASLRVVVYGGMPAYSPAIAAVEAIERALPELQVIQIYGQTVTGPVLFQQPADRRINHRAMGRPSTRLDVALLADPGRRASTGEIGEIAVRGTQVSPGYCSGDLGPGSRSRSDDEWERTGDLAVVDHAGQWTFAGRIHDAINAGGTQVHPFELEQIAIAHPHVADCAAFGIADPHWGALPAIAVVAKPKTRINTREIDALFTGADIGAFKRPRAVFVVDRLPYSSAGEILRSELQRRFPSV